MEYSFELGIGHNTCNTLKHGSTLAQHQFDCQKGYALYEQKCLDERYFHLGGN